MWSDLPRSTGASRRMLTVDQLIELQRHQDMGAAENALDRFRELRWKGALFGAVSAAGDAQRFVASELRSVYSAVGGGLFDGFPLAIGEAPDAGSVSSRGDFLRRPGFTGRDLALLPDHATPSLPASRPLTRRRPARPFEPPRPVATSARAHAGRETPDRPPPISCSPWAA